VAISVDGNRIAGNRFDAIDDGREHRIDVVLRKAGTVVERAEREAQVAGTRR